MSDEHKVVLAEGRRQAPDIRAYLEALGSRRPGRPVTPETLAARLARIEARLAGESDVLRQVELMQQRLDVEEALEAAQQSVDIDALGEKFAESAKAYGARKGIGYAAWRAAGVPAAVLKASGIRQTRNRRSGVN